VVLASALGHLSVLDLARSVLVAVPKDHAMRLCANQPKVTVEQALQTEEVDDYPEDFPSLVSDLAINRLLVENYSLVKVSLYCRVSLNFELMYRYAHLRDVTLTRDFEDAALRVMAKYCTKLTSFKIVRNRIVTDKGIGPLLSGNRHTLLVIACISCPRLTDGTVQTMRHCSVVENIQMTRCDTRKSMVSFLTNNCPSLHYLVCSHVDGKKPEGDKEERFVGNIYVTTYRMAAM
jgi:hypothetical protein